MHIFTAGQSTRLQQTAVEIELVEVTDIARAVEEKKMSVAVEKA